MFQIIITVIAILLFVSFLVAGTGYVSFSKVSSISIATDFESRLNRISLSISRYQTLYGKLPSDTATLVKYLKDDFRTSEPDLDSVNLFNMNYKINSEHPYDSIHGYSLELCFGTDSDIPEEQITQDGVDGIVELQKRISNSLGKDDKINIGLSCGSTINVIPTEYPTKLWVTYRID